MNVRNNMLTLHRSGRNLLSSGHRDEAGGWSMEPRPWSSTDSSGYGTDSSAKQRLSMTKASSFHSVTLLSRPSDHIGGSTGAGGGKLSKTGEFGGDRFIRVCCRWFPMIGEIGRDLWMFFKCETAQTKINIYNWVNVLFFALWNTICDWAMVR